MQKLQDSAFAILKTTSLSTAVFSFLQPTDDGTDKIPLGGILNDTKHGWLALGSKFCVIDLRTGLKIAAWTFGVNTSSVKNTVLTVTELPTPLTENSQQLIISLECDDTTGLIAIFHVNGSQILHCIQTEVIVTELTVCDVPDGPFMSFDNLVVAGTNSGEILVFDLHRAALLQALKDLTQGNEQLIRKEQNMANLTFLPLKAVSQIAEQRDMALENDEHIAILLNENSLVDSQFLFHNPDGTIRMKAKRDHIRVSTMKYIPQLGSVTIGYNFGAFQIWNLMTLDLEFTSQVNVECLPVTHFGFQEPCDDPRAFCYLWVVYSTLDRLQEDQFPLAVMYSLTYQGKRMLSDTKCLYQDFSTSNIRFQVELSTSEGSVAGLAGGRCVACNTFSIHSTLADEGEDSTLNICQLVWECWKENATFASEYGMLLFDLDQWYKDQMPATYQLQSNTFMCVSSCELPPRDACRLLAATLAPRSVAAYSHATRLEEHFYPNSLQYNCICLNTSEVVTLHTPGVQRQIISSILWLGERALLAPSPLYLACLGAGLTPLYAESRGASVEQQRRFLLSVALEARLTQFLKKIAHDWATGAHAGVGCTLPFMVEWCWHRAAELKQSAVELTAPLFSSAALPDRNVTRCLEHAVRQLTDLTGLLDNVLTKCCNLVVPDALSEMEEKHKGISTVALYFRAVQWLLGAGLLPERRGAPHTSTSAPTVLPYPASALTEQYRKRRLKLHRIQDGNADDTAGGRSCSLLYIDQLIEFECGGEKIHEMWRKGGEDHNGLYPPPTLYALLKLYLRPEIADEHKHSLILYLLLDYSMLYDDIRYETVIRRLMQFPTMFGLSNTAIKATQAFWHLDHRDFDFALDQLQCLTGNTLSSWQHSVVLSSLLAQKKTQQALQYLHVRKPPPKPSSNENFGDCDKLECWQSSCELYLARGLVFEALDVIRMCAANANTLDDRLTVMNFFYKGCRNTGQLCKLLEASLQPFEEEVFIRFLESCNDQLTSDILVMYYLQQARYLEAQQYNARLRPSKPKPNQTQTNLTASVESLLDFNDKAAARDTIIDVVCGTLPHITGKVAHTAMYEFDAQTHVLAPKPMSVFVQAKSPNNNKFTYKSSFIQDTIENASETWVNKPQMRKGLKRALNIEEIPFLCTPKLNRHRSNFSPQDITEGTPPKRLKLDLSPKTPKIFQSSVKISEQLTKEIETLLDMPEVQSPLQWRIDLERERGTPHSILKIRRSAMGMETASPVDSRYLADSDDEMADTASNHTHLSDKHLRFEIPSTVSECGSTPSPSNLEAEIKEKERERSASLTKERERDISVDSYNAASNTMQREGVLESPKPEPRKSYKDTVRARRSLSISNSSLSEDPNASIESIADLPYNLVNTKYNRSVVIDNSIDSTTDTVGAVITPKGRRPIGNSDETWRPERLDSPVATPVSIRRLTRSKSRTPERSPVLLDPIAEQPKQEVESDPHPVKTALTLTVPRLRSRSRSRTPERQIAPLLESPKLEAITESPTKMEVVSEAPATMEVEAPPSPRKVLRSRSRTPEVEAVKEAPTILASPRSLRSRSKTPDREKVLTLQEKPTKTRKSLSRIVLEHNTFKPREEINQSETDSPKKTNQASGNIFDTTFSPINKPVLHSRESETDPKPTEVEINQPSDSTPKKANQNPGKIFDMTFSPINKSVLQTPVDSFCESDETKSNKTNKSFAFSSFNETSYEKSVLKSYQSSADGTTESVETSQLIVKEMRKSDVWDATTSKSVLKDSSLMTSDSDDNTSIQQEKQKIVDIEREIHEIEGDISEDEAQRSSNDENDDDDESSEDDDAGDEAGDEEQEEEHDVISIRDTSDDSSSTDQLHIDEESNTRQSHTSQSTVRNNFEEFNVYKGFGTMKFKKDTENNEEIVTTKQEDEVTKGLELEKKVTQDDDATQHNEFEKKVTQEDDATQHNEFEKKVTQDDDATQYYEVEKKTVTQEDGSTKYYWVEKKVTQVDGATQHYEVERDAVNKAEETVEKQDVDTDSQKTIEYQYQDIIPEPKEPKIIEDKVENSNKEDDPLAPNVSLLTDDNSECEQSMNLNFSDEKDKEGDAMDEDAEVKIVIVVEESQTSDTGTANTEEITNTDNIEKAEITEDVVDAVTQQPEEMETEKVIKTRKRAKSTSSNQSTNDNVEKPTPLRKRTKSTASNQSEASEDLSTPIRRILTRRASRELAEKSAEESMIVEDVTPKRLARSRSKSKTEDNVSEASVKSQEVKEVRKGRKSILASKPELSVIPEVSADDNTLLADYTSLRRLTRNQRSMLESWLEPATPSRRRNSRQSSISESIEIEDDVSSTTSKGTKESGSPERDAAPDTSPVFVPEVKPKRRLSRAASETQTASTSSTATKAKPTRRGSIDVANLTGSELDLTASPSGRARRACFSKAVEALSTPKRERRPSTDTKAPSTPQRERRASTDTKRSNPSSTRSSPAPEESPITPARRPRRASTQRAAAETSTTPRRTKKTSTSEETKGGKK